MNRAIKDETMSIIGQSMFNFQAVLKQSGSSLEDYLGKYYYNKWMGKDTLCHQPGTCA